MAIIYLKTSKIMQNSSCFLLPNKHRKFEKIPYSDILYLEGNINYTLIHLKDGQVKLSPRTLLFHVNNSLNESFLRIHRAFCVNKEHIEHYDGKENAYSLKLKTGIKLAVSRRKRHVLL
jgi:DNA-binding LytR/AlgR family response regulator